MSEATATAGRRQRRWQDVHDRLYEAAAELFVRKGFGNTSFDEIADLADVARKTAFNHFPRKKDFIREWGVRRRAQASAAISAELLDHPDLEVVLRKYLAQMASLSTEQRPLTRAMMAGWRECGGPFDGDTHVLIEVFTDLVQAAVERGQTRQTAEPRRVATLLYSAYFGVLFDWSEGGEPPFDLNEEFMRVLDVILGGLLNAPAD
ncbi:TetR/AcrR family transcriptional regulator [Actinomadura madurae]|uniref:TetR/AcrR family transcriptional regulator n=1 Tax=Actinomadura madurae TaxID=1993 RepID=UPI000D9B65D0|nr:TetR/AcrR family transcriptional regulator [Actinomadura madurae]SPT51269.1 HTH-type transcriptional regulator luxR [Actinomadura madurae]